MFFLKSVYRLSLSRFGVLFRKHGQPFPVNASTRYVQIGFESDAFTNDRQRSMWDGIETLNILTEIALALLPIYILWDLHLAWAKKSLVMAAFALRLL